MPSTSTSTRWCPTPEQLMILEEIYRRGTRTPNATQIQRITAHLSLYGKIQGKNVFYWFQNHKARDRRRMGRKIINKRHHHHQQQDQHNNNNHILHRFIQCPPCSAANYTSPKINNAGVFLSQGGIFGSPPTQKTSMNRHKWKMDVPEKIVEMEKSSSAKMYVGDWTMMILEIGSSSLTSPTICCPPPPLKTLQLFPTTPTNLKD